MSSLQGKLKSLGAKFPSLTSEEIDKQVKPVLKKMEQNGIKLDCDAVKKLDKKLSGDLEKTEEEIKKLAGHDFNISSPTQLAEVLFSELKLPKDDIKKTKSGLSTAASELKKIEKTHKIIPLILEQRELSKLISTYLKPLPTLVDENDRLHTTYGLETTTGRLTSSEPNLQNIPIKGKYGNDIRAAFIAEKGYKLISADYSQIELRVVACLAQDKAMMKSFEKGEDIHTRTASEIFEVSLVKVTANQRRIAKAVNFGIVYGQTPFGLSKTLGIETSKAAEYIMHYFDIHKGIKNYVNQMIEKAHTDGYVETLFGMKRYLPNINSRIRYIAEGEERMAINTPVQGTAAEILKLAMIELDRKLESWNREQRTGATTPIPLLSGSPSARGGVRGGGRKGQGVMENNEIPNTASARMLLTVHDELVVEAPKKEIKEVAKIVEKTMTEVVKLCVPIEISLGIGKNWAEAK